VKDLKASYQLTIKDRIQKLAAALPDDAFLQGVLTSTALIQKAMEEDECIFFIVYGPVRYGKTAYAMKTLAQVQQTWNPDILKKYIVFKPEDFITKVKRLREKKEKQSLLIWEDAGVWLNCMKWNDPLVIAISKYLDVSGTDWGGIMFTTPLPGHVIRRIRGLPDCITVKIIKEKDDPNKPRLANGYKMSMLPDLKKSIVKPVFNDRFSALMPNVFYSWYQNYRRMFTDEQFKEVEENLYRYFKAEGGLPIENF
jgi:hypothetical protein